MRKRFIIMFICIAIILLSACGENLIQDESSIETTENQSILVDQEKEIYRSVIAEEKEFYEIILENPIDKTFIWDGDVGSEARIRKAIQYQDLWNTEIEHSLIILKENLTQEDYDMLEIAYANWRQYMDTTRDIEQEIFYLGSSYGTGSSLTYPLVMEAYAERTKEYAVELKALVYAFTGTVEFAAHY